MADSSGDDAFMDDDASASADAVIEDVPHLLQKLTERVGEMKEKMRLVGSLEEDMSYVETAMSRIQDQMEEEARARREEEEELQEETSGSTNDLKLTQSAKEIIGTMAFPLDSQKFLDLLMNKVFNKPKPLVLPIIRKYTKDVAGLRLQFMELRADLRARHSAYMEENKKDKYLGRRIDLLLKNIERELADEDAQGRHQTTLEDFKFSSQPRT